MSARRPLTSSAVKGGANMAESKSNKSIIQCQLKLKLRPAQERMLVRWLWRLTGAYNWAVRKIENDAACGVYRSSWSLEALLRGHGAKIGVPSHVLQATVRTASAAWRRRFDREGGRPRLKGRRNRLNSIPFPDPLFQVYGDRISVSGVGRVRFHEQDIPLGRIKSGRIVRRASGWYLCLFIEGEPAAIQCSGSGAVGIDPGYSSLITLSTGEKVGPAREQESGAQRLAQAQRGTRRRLTARMLERQRNRRKDRNHKLSRRLVADNALIAWSKDSHRSFARLGFGRSVVSAAHGQLRQMLAYKCRSGSREFVEVPNRYSTVTCSSCGQRTGPHGRAGLKVRTWTCGCGAQHDRDVNAARNTLMAALGTSVERPGDGSSGIPQ